MTDMKHFSERRKGMDPMIAGAIAVAGAAIGTAATIYLSKKENREKIDEKISLLKSKAKDTLDTLKEKGENKKNEIKSKGNMFAA